HAAGRVAPARPRPRLRHRHRDGRRHHRPYRLRGALRLRGDRNGDEPERAALPGGPRRPDPRERARARRSGVAGRGQAGGRAADARVLAAGGRLRRPRAAASADGARGRPMKRALVTVALTAALTLPSSRLTTVGAGPGDLEALVK